MHAHFSIDDPLDMYLKKLRKIFPNVHPKIKLKIIIFKNSKLSFKGGFVPDIFAGGRGKSQN